ncbi:hypothetical protein F5B22DRAFT_644630 [Xylaria bambusicola]|uniref:uncharacterized protein n=1 Tax=Xylaria bambusicola TaxID=326684 RepID=UPI002007378E|nr:uncharacterized protein F5B22DRAFT_644630 [Xylaria bambusicola]KAI0520889.1 hypothetical protein F5B22DRAFT_644630 [Xylaria bambusicola]
MGPKFLTALALSALACASAIDTQLVGNSTRAPDATCYWDGTSPFCAGSCPTGYEDCATSGCGDGACCWTGYKKFCCRGGCPDRETLAIEIAKEFAAPKPEFDAGLNGGLDGGDVDGVDVTTSDHQE